MALDEYKKPWGLIQQMEIYLQIIDGFLDERLAKELLRKFIEELQPKSKPRKCK